MAKTGGAVAGGCPVRVLAGGLEPIWRRFVARPPGPDRASPRPQPKSTQTAQTWALSGCAGLTTDETRVMGIRLWTTWGTSATHSDCHPHGCKPKRTEPRSAALRAPGLSRGIS